MKEQKITFIIPGFKHRPSGKAYKEVAKMLKKQGYTPVPVKMHWKQRTLSENTDFFIRQYKQKLGEKGSKKLKKKTYILGFSLGAMIAFIAATKVKVSGLILCSLSPFFKEDLPKTKPRYSYIEKYRYEDFKKIQFKKLAKKVKAKKVALLYGEEESKPLVRRVTKAYKQIPTAYKYLLSVKKTEHNIGDKKYLRTIHHVTANFL